MRYIACIYVISHYKSDVTLKKIIFYLAADSVTFAVAINHHL